MSQRLDTPFNIELLVLTPEFLKGIRPVRSLDITEGATNNLHPDGLYSTEIFGKVGDKRRKSSFSYIDIKVSIFHPLIYKRLTKMRSFYQEIMSGAEYAVWNPEIKDFERSAAIDGQTGFDFFVSHWREINIEDTNSTERDQTIRLLAKYGDVSMTSKVIVMPAGYRDLEYENNRIRESDINSYYKKMMAISNAIADMAVRLNPAALNRARYTLQMRFNELYHYIESLVEGKQKLLMGKWARRATFNGTRNVITAMLNDARELNGPGEVGFNHTQIGIYQAAKNILPKTQFLLRNGILHDVFVSIDRPAYLVDRKTLKREEVWVKPEVFDYWGSDEGIEKVITSLADESIRHKPVIINGYYLALVYKDDGYFKVFYDIDDLPEGFSRKNVFPITMAELIYISLYKEIGKYPLLLTRYPVTGIGSIYPSLVYLRTTVRAKQLRQLDDNWAPLQGDEYVAHQFPIVGEAFVNSMIPHSARLALLGADFDGDTASGPCVYSDNAVEENHQFMKMKKAYIGTNGKPLASIDVSTLALIFHNLTVE